MIDDSSPSAKDLKKKFHEWFRDYVPANPSSPAKTDHSVEGFVPFNLQFPSDTEYLYDKMQKLVEVFCYGLVGAVSLVAVVGSIIFMMDLNLMEWSHDHHDLIVLVFFIVVAIGFLCGMLIGASYKLNES